MVYSQDFAFRVLANKGEIKVKTSESKWVVLKTGARLNNGDKLKIPSKSYLGLVHSSGRTLELTETGSFDIKKLSEKIGRSSGTMVSKYVDYVISKMTPEAIENNRRKYASVTGSVERGVFDSDIHLYLPLTVTVLNSYSIVRWSSIKDAVYIVELKNIFGEIIVEFETNDNFYALDFEDKNIKNELISGFLILQIKLKDKRLLVSQKVSIKKINKSEAQELMASLSTLKDNIGSESSLNNIILAEYYEENELILDAITCFEKAIKRSPDVEFFQEAYDEFLIRNGLKIPTIVDSDIE